MAAMATMATTMIKGDESAIAVRVENETTTTTTALVRRDVVSGEKARGDALTTTTPTRVSSETARESTRDFVARKREIFLVRMDAENKLREIARLETEASRREEALSKSAKRRQEAFVAPKEDAPGDGEEKKKKKRASEVGADDVAAMTASLKAKGKASKEEGAKRKKKEDAASFVMGEGEPKKKKKKRDD